jgi:hypothetical protein
MAHAQPSLSAPLDADRRALLADLERVGSPTPYAKGALRALSLAALDPADRRRVDALSAKWAQS